MKKVKVELGVYVREFVTFTVDVPDHMDDADIQRVCVQAYKNGELQDHEDSESWETDYDAGVEVGGATVIAEPSQDDRDYMYSEDDDKFIVAG